MVKIKECKKKEEKKLSAVQYRRLLNADTKEVGEKRKRLEMKNYNGVSGEDEGIWGSAIEMSGGFFKRQRGDDDLENNDCCHSKWKLGICNMSTPKDVDEQTPIVRFSQPRENSEEASGSPSTVVSKNISLVEGIYSKRKEKLLAIQSNENKEFREKRHILVKESEARLLQEHLHESALVRKMHPEIDVRLVELRFADKEFVRKVESIKTHLKTEQEKLESMHRATREEEKELRHHWLQEAKSGKSVDEFCILPQFLNSGFNLEDLKHFGEPPSEPLVPQLPILTYNDSPVFTQAEQLQVSTTANLPTEHLLLNSYTDNSSVVPHVMQLEPPTPVDSLPELVQSNESEGVVPLAVHLQRPLPTDQTSVPESGMRVSENSLLCQPAKEDNHLHFLKFDEELASICKVDRAHSGPIRNCQLFENSDTPQVSPAVATISDIPGPVTAPSLIGRCPSGVANGTEPPDQSSEPGSGMRVSENSLLCQQVKEEDQVQVLKFDEEVATIPRGDRDQPRRSGNDSDSESDNSSSDNEAERRISTRTISEHSLPAEIVSKPSTPRFKVKADKDKGEKDDLKLTKDLSDEEGKMSLYEKPDIANHSSKSRNRSPNICGSMSPKRSPRKIPRLQSTSHVRQSSMQDLRTNSRGPALKSPEPSLCNPRSFHYRGRNAQDMNHDRFGRYKNYSKRSLPSRYQSPPRSFHYRGRIAQDMNRDRYGSYTNYPECSLPSRYRSPPRSFHYKETNVQDMNHGRFGSYTNYPECTLPSRYWSPPRSFHYRGRHAQDMNGRFRSYKKISKRSLPSRYQSPPRRRSPTSLGTGTEA